MTITDHITASILPQERGYSDGGAEYGWNECLSEVRAKLPEIIGAVYAEVNKKVTEYVQEAIKDPKSDNYIYAEMVPLNVLDRILTPDGK